MWRRRAVQTNWSTGTSALLNAAAISITSVLYSTAYIINGTIASTLPVLYSTENATNTTSSTLPVNVTISPTTLPFTIGPVVMEKPLTRENLVFLVCCFVFTVLNYVWLSHFIFASLKILHECTNRYDQWFNKLKGLDHESRKWCRTYWIFEQNNMLLQTLDSPRFWPMDPVAGKAIFPFEVRQPPSAEAKGVTHYKLPEHHFVGKPSTLTRLLTDPEYLHSVEIYTRLHNSGVGKGEWDKFRQNSSEPASNCDHENRFKTKKKPPPKERKSSRS